MTNMGKCAMCGKEATGETGGCGLQIAYICNRGTSMLTRVYCGDCYKKYVDPHLRSLNDSAELGIAFNKEKTEKEDDED